MSFAIYMIIIGAAAGFLATRVMDINLNTPTTIAVGVLGALVGGALLRLILAAMGLIGGFVGAVLGAVALIWLYQRYLGNR